MEAANRYSAIVIEGAKMGGRISVDLPSEHFEKLAYQSKILVCEFISLVSMNEKEMKSYVEFVVKELRSERGV